MADARALVHARACMPTTDAILVLAGQAVSAVSVDDQLHGQARDSCDAVPDSVLEPIPSVFAKMEAQSLGPEQLVPFQQPQQPQLDLSDLQALAAADLGDLQTLPSTVLHAPQNLYSDFEQLLPMSPSKSFRLQHSMSHPVYPAFLDDKLPPISPFKSHRLQHSISHPVILVIACAAAANLALLEVVHAWKCMLWRLSTNAMNTCAYTCPVS